MSYLQSSLFADLRSLLTTLGNNGGSVGPSIYDTAQVLRFAPPQDTGPAVTWLLDRQQSDGGWSDPTVPRTRDLPTLAAILSLSSVVPTRAKHAIAAGLKFLHRQADYWAGPLPEDIPVGIELLLPNLLREAQCADLLIDQQPYSELIRLGEKRRQIIAERHYPAGTTPIHSWEALGVAADPDVIDGSGGVGHSPAATAAWLSATTGSTALAKQRAAAFQYLEQAAFATDTGIPGVMPTVWPVTNFERVWVLYALQLAGLLRYNQLHDLVEPQIEQVSQSISRLGLGMSTWFITDGDVTSTSLAMLAGAGRKPDLTILQRFAQPATGGYTTYLGELQHSISATAHSAHAIALLGGDASTAIQALQTRRSPAGIWSGDKWHSSWLYLTSHTIAAYCAAGQAQFARESLPAIRAARQSDGSWGPYAYALEDTAYAVLALLALERAQALDASDYLILQQAEHWMQQHYALLEEQSQARWIGKEPYWPQRVVRATVLSAILGVRMLVERGVLA